MSARGGYFPNQKDSKSISKGRLFPNQKGNKIVGKAWLLPQPSTQTLTFNLIPRV
jgi:hypothetical protein